MCFFVAYSNESIVFYDRYTMLHTVEDTNNRQEIQFQDETINCVEGGGRCVILNMCLRYMHLLLLNVKVIEGCYLYICYTAVLSIIDNVTGCFILTCKIVATWSRKYLRISDRNKYTQYTVSYFRLLLHLILFVQLNK